MPRLLAVLLLLLFVGFTARPATAHDHANAGDLHRGHRAVAAALVAEVPAPETIVTARADAPAGTAACPGSTDRGTAPHDCACPTLCSALALPEATSAPVLMPAERPAAAPPPLWREARHVPPVPPPRALSA